MKIGKIIINKLLNIFFYAVVTLSITAPNAATTSTFSWDAHNKLTQQTASSGASILYAYDADGRRIQRVTNGQVTNYLWDEASANGDVAVETDVNHAPQARYLLGNEQLVAQERSGSTSFYLQDGQQNVRALTDTTGSVTDSYLYDAYGNLQNRTGTTVNPYQYTGQQLDSLTGLYNLRARNYDPSVGRFLSQDSAALNAQNPLELNRYVYTANNPVSRFDPSGHSLFEFSFSVQKAVTVGIVAGGLLAIWYVIYRALPYLYSLPQPQPLRDWLNWTPRVLPGGNCSSFFRGRGITIGWYNRQGVPNLYP